MSRLEVIAPEGVPLLGAGDDLAKVLLQALENAGIALRDDDIVVVAQKVVSKSEGRQIALVDVTPGSKAIELAQQCKRDPVLVELIIQEAQEIVRATEAAIIVEHRLGFVLANAGIDQSNIDHTTRSALLLPLDPDASARRLRASLRAATGADVGVIIIDSIGRAWRKGTIGTAIGVAGLPGLLDLRRKPDLFGRELQSTELGLADEIAAAASLMMGQSNEGRPFALVRGIPYPRREGSADELIRPREQDLFR